METIDDELGLRRLFCEPSALESFVHDLPVFDAMRSRERLRSARRLFRETEDTTNNVVPNNEALQHQPTTKPFVIDDESNDEQKDHPHVLDDSKTPLSPKIDIAEKEKHKEEKQSGLYNELLRLQELSVIPNFEEIECPVCFNTVPPMSGIALRSCGHHFCRECVTFTIKYSHNATVKCPYNSGYAQCNETIEDCLIRDLLSPAEMDEFLKRSLRIAETGASNSFHCKTPNCTEWCFYEEGVNAFHCSGCDAVNCITCQAIHPGVNCLQYQNRLLSSSALSDDELKSKDHLDSLLCAGEAMKCTQCDVIIIRPYGCDWIVCSYCKTELCWATKGARWGPNGYGDTTGGCRCKINGVKCHPKCTNCH